MNRVLIIAVMGIGLVAGSKGQQNTVTVKPQAATNEPAASTPAKVGEDVPGSNNQLVYEKVQPLTDLEQSAVEGFNAKAAMIQNQMTQLQQQGQKLIAELKTEHKVDGQWLVSPDGKSLVMVKQKTPTKSPVPESKAPPKPAATPSPKK